MGAKVDDLAMQAAEALRRGQLPRVRVEEVSGSYGASGRCGLCNEAIGDTQLSAHVRLGRVDYVMHVNCFTAWQMAVPPE